MSDATVLETDQTSRTVRFGITSLAIVAGLIGHYLYRFYTAASSDEAGWSFLFMPILLGILLAVAASATLPMIAAVNARNHKAIWVALGVVLPMAFNIAVSSNSPRTRYFSEQTEDAAGLTLHCWLIMGAVWVIAAFWLIRQNLANDHYMQHIRDQKEGRDR